jgi:peroxiredoxin
MKYFISFCLLVSTTFWVTAQQKSINHHFLLNGTVEGKSTGAVYMRYLGVKGKFVVDSGALQQGRFSLKGLINGPTIAFIGTNKKAIPDDEVMEADGKNSALVFLEAKKMTANLAVANFKNGQYTGSASQLQLMELNRQTALLNDRFKTSIDSLKTTNQLKSDEKEQAIQQLSQRNETMKATALRQFLGRHPNSYVTAYLVSISHFKLDTLKLYYNRLSAAVKKSSYGDDILEKIKKKQKIAVGHLAPDFTQKSADSSEVSLKQFRGKYLLLIFWSTSSAASRAQNKNLVSIYNQYKSKNFTILGASVDGEKTRKVWQAAIQNDGLPWMQLAALKSNHNPAAIAYDIESLPSTFLIDPNGKIIATDLKLEKLSEKLERVLK